MVKTDGRMYVEKHPSFENIINPITGAKEGDAMVSERTACFVPKLHYSQRFFLSRFSGALFRIQGAIGAPEKLLGCFAFLVPHPSGREADLNFRAGKFSLHGAQPVQKNLDLAGRAFREQHQKLVPSHARGNVRFPGGKAETPGELL
jgi:hypothetical protein